MGVLRRSLVKPWGCNGYGVAYMSLIRSPRIGTTCSTVRPANRAFSTVRRLMWVPIAPTTSGSIEWKVLPGPDTDLQGSAHRLSDQLAAPFVLYHAVHRHISLGD